MTPEGILPLEETISELRGQPWGVLSPVTVSAVRWLTLLLKIEEEKRERPPICIRCGQAGHTTCEAPLS